MEKEKTKKVDALKVAAMIGCSGAHKNENGEWLPCSSPKILDRISNAAESDSWLKNYKKSGYKVLDVIKKPRKMGKRRRMRDNWEKLNERPIRGITGLPGVGIVTAIPGEAGMVAKSSFMGPEYVRDNDPDVFTDPESARARSRQLGCIGISRRTSKTGKTVWMPCTNMSDYARVSGSTSLGRRGMGRERSRAIRTVVREELRKITGRKK